MKQGWQIKKLGEVCDIINGRNQKAVECADGQYPIYGSGGNIMGYASDYLCESGTTIIGRKGSINNPIYIDTPFWNVDTAFGISPKSMMSSKYVYYFCKLFDFSKLNKGTTLPSLVKKDLLLIDIPVPLLPEQQRIVNLLDAEFAKIDTLKANAERNLQNAKDLFQAALMKELEPKDGWGKYRTDEVCVVSPSKSEVKKKNLKDVDWVSFLPMEDMTIGIKNVCPLQVKPFGEVSGSYTYFEDNDVLLAKVTPCFENGKLGITRNLKNGVGYGSSEFIVFRANSELVQPDYLYYCMQEPSFLKEGKKRMIGACGLKRLPKDFVKTRPLGIPSLTKQQSIVARLDVLNEKCKTLQANYEKTLSLCDDLKQALLRKAFNGEI